MRRFALACLAMGLVITSVFVIAVVVKDTAHAQDKRPCVSKREFTIAPFIKRAALEHRWEVEGLGRRHSPMVSDASGRYLIYPACGYSRRVAFVLVWFNAYDGATDMLRAVPTDRAPHGLPRAGS